MKLEHTAKLIKSYTQSEDIHYKSVNIEKLAVTFQNVESHGRASRQQI